MKRTFLALVLAALALANPSSRAWADTFTTGRPDIKSISALAFGPEGVLFVGDGKGGAVFAIDLGARPLQAVKEPKEITDVEGKLAALLGATPADVMIHDLAVDPVGKRPYVAVSRGRAPGTCSGCCPTTWRTRRCWCASTRTASRRSWTSPRSATRAWRCRTRSTRPRRSPGRRRRCAPTPSPTSAFADGTLYVAGLSNEEFAASMWKVAYPFAGAVSVTTIENYHGAHGKYETEAPVRTFVPYPLKGKTHLLAAYLCTPLVTFQASDLKDKQHVRGRTVGEFGSGNYPLDMVLVKTEGKDKLLIANSNLPLMIVDPSGRRGVSKVRSTSTVKTYTAGVAFEQRSGTGIQQMDNLGDEHVVVLRRLAGGRLDLTPMPVRRF